MVSINNISKSYNNTKALSDISLNLVKGEIVALLGKNGAGKSTLMKIIAGTLEPDTGDVQVDSTQISSDRLNFNKHIGYLSEENPLYDDMYVGEYLEYIVDIYNSDKKYAHTIVNRLALQSELTKKIASLSKGNRQRVGIAQTLMHKPSIIIMDESTNGLDPVQRDSFLSLLVELSVDSIVLLSTHVLQEVKQVCTRFIVIDDGQIVTDRPVNLLASIEEQFYR